MAIFDDEPVKKPKPHEIGQDLSLLSVAELTERIGLLRAEIVRLDCGATGIDPQDILAALATRGLNRILVEGGARTIARFIDAGLVDHLHVAVAPLIIGSGPSGLSLPPIDRLTAAYRPPTEVYCLGSDILFDCRLKSTASGRHGEKIRMTDHA